MLKELALISALAGAVPQPVAPPKSALPFIDDDYAKALAEARTRQVPIFVEAWAPW
ncbi:MAG: hypothetical protein HYX75_02740 [Acidobacteria bacterium]|nr:hypothetical protein [Acidobacteriota bacterium]